MSILFFKELKGYFLFKRITTLTICYFWQTSKPSSKREPGRGLVSCTATEGEPELSRAVGTFSGEKRNLEITLKPFVRAPLSRR